MTRLPLDGVRVVVARARAQSAGLVEALEKQGATAVAVPVIEIQDPADGGAALRAGLDALTSGDWLVITSPNGATRVAAALDGRAIGNFSNYEADLNDFGDYVYNCGLTGSSNSNALYVHNGKTFVQEGTALPSLNGATLSNQNNAAFLIAIAENDDERDPNAKVLLREAFDANGVKAEIEVYEGTLHGWCPLDSAVYNEAQAERAWSRLLVLFERELA